MIEGNLPSQLFTGLRRVDSGYLKRSNFPDDKHAVFFHIFSYDSEAFVPNIHQKLYMQRKIFLAQFLKNTFRNQTKNYSVK